jgi:hypothetical protein
MRFSTNRFSYFKDLDLFTACASDLELPPGNLPMALVLVSAKTGMAVGMQYCEDNRTLDDELQSRVYEIVPHQQHMGTFKVEIFND